MRIQLQTNQLTFQIPFILMMYGLVLLLNWALDPDQFGWIDLKLHPFALIVIMSALRFGRQAGLLSGIFGATLLLSIRFYQDGFPDYFEDVLTWHVLDLPCVLMALGFFLGDVRLQLALEIARLNEELEAMKENRKILKENVSQLEDANLTLRERAYGQLSPASKLYRTAKQMETLDLEEVYANALSLIKEHLKAERCTFYIEKNKVLHPVAYVGWDDEEIPAYEGGDAGRNQVLDLVMQEGRLISLREKITWKSGQFRQGLDVVMAAKVKAEDSGISGVVTVEELPFLQLTEASEQSLQMIADWASMAIDRVQYFNVLKSQAIFDQELGVHSEEHLLSSLKREFDRARRSGQDFLIFKLRIKDFDKLAADSAFYGWKIIGQTLMRTLRTTDLVSRASEPGCLWIMCTGPGMEADFMRNRLRAAVADLLSEDAEKGLQLEFSDSKVPGPHKSVDELLSSLG